MPAPFEELSEAELPQDLREMKTSIEENYERISVLFRELESNPKRLKPLPGMPLPTLSIPYELMTVQVLRTLELADGAALMIERGNHPSAFPLLRGLMETWLTLAYATVRFRALVVDAKKWDRFDEIASRLLQGQTSDPEAKAVIEIGQVRSAVRDAMSSAGQSDVGEALEQTYAELSDGTHPTIWSLAYYGGERGDGLGVNWSRKSEQGGMGGPLFDFDTSLKLILGEVERLYRTAEEVDAAFKEEFSQDKGLRQQTVAVLRAMLAGSGNAPDEQRRILEERIKALLESYGDEGQS